MVAQLVHLGLNNVRKIRLTSGCSQIATARFFDYFLPAKLVYNVSYLAHPQSAEPRALGRRNISHIVQFSLFGLSGKQMMSTIKRITI